MSVIATKTRAIKLRAVKNGLTVETPDFIGTGFKVEGDVRLLVLRLKGDTSDFPSFHDRNELAQALGTKHRVAVLCVPHDVDVELLEEVRG
jgi:hypothetical protein